MNDLPPLATREHWDQLSDWFSAWLSADEAERERLRAQLALEHPDLVASADAMTGSSRVWGGFLETPALVLAARELAHEDSLLSPGDTIGPYRIVRLLARGGMGDVYRATDVRLQRDIALKVLAETRTNDPQRVDRFMKEARATASLDHPNVVRVYDVGRVDGRAYLIAELLEGETLRSRISRGPMPAGEVLRMAIEIVSGLGAAHGAGLVHRDLKPENIFLTRSGAAKILDFGIAKLAQDETVADGFSTLTGVVLGTAGYLAPEQIRGERVDARADLFAVGVVLFEALTGTRAFAREHLVETLYAILHDPPADAVALRDASPAVTDIVMRLLEKAPASRFQSCTELMTALESIEVDAVPSPSPTARSETSSAPLPKQGPAPAGRPARLRHARRAVGALIGLATAAVALTWYASAPFRAPSADATRVTLAVMPFRSIPAGSGDDLLELGLADVLVSRLGQLAEIRVLPLMTVERLRSRGDTSDAVRRLGATHLLTGTIQRDERRVRATVRLVSTADDRTLWSTPIDADASSAFSIQDIIVTRVVGELAPRLSAGTRRSLSDPGTRDGRAFEAYLRGRAFVLKATRAELVRAIEFFNEALKLDPGYADGWAGLASAYRRMTIGGDVPPSEAFEQAKRAANEALRIDPDHAEAHSALGTVAFWYEWDYGRAERLLRRALDLQPSSGDSQTYLAHLFSNLGRHDEALEHIRRARAFDPDWPVPRSLEGQFLLMARRYEESLERLDALVQAEPEFAGGHVMRVYPLLALQRYDDAIEACARTRELRRRVDGSEQLYSWGAGLEGYALARMGRPADAVRVLDDLRKHAGSQYVSPYAEALVLHALGREDAALERLQASVRVRDHRVTFLGVDPKWDELRGRPAFRDILSQVHLLDVSDRIRR
jgi:serine/threonine protein kinase/TolB-like protein/tetratricopeptide (TPR) repeat protein